MTRPLNPLTMPLDGLHVIEASAGTGKTWTLAALYVRLVLGHGRGGPESVAALYPPQILVMTFTEAATSELRGRIRARLAEAARYFKNAEGEGEKADDFLTQLRADIPEQQWPLCAYRLDMSAQWMDDAAIFTIHGWSSRMPKPHAFDSASLFQQSRVEDSDQLRLLAVQDYWRQWFYALPLSQLGALKAVGATPDQLLSNLKPLWSATDKAPGLTLPAARDPHTLLAEWESWCRQLEALEANARSAYTPGLTDLLDTVIAARTLKSYRKDWPGKLADYLQGETFQLLNKKDADSAIKLMERFALTRLQTLGWTKAVDYPVFGHLEALFLHLQAQPDMAFDLLNHAALHVDQAYRQAKDRSAQFDFSDLLQCLYVALQARDGRLAAAIQQQYPVALVDEFQDTDPWQYGALSRIYAESDRPDSSLIMIGDPKQAIYSFRGADLNTYLKAREQARAIHTLSGNFRSTPGLVAAVNHVFGMAQHPFGDVPFEDVEACSPKAVPLEVAGITQSAMTVWHLDREEAPNADTFMALMADIFAAQMVSLLNAKAAEPGAMAVLVRSGKQARAMRQALSRRGVRSVYLSERDSVFETAEAKDLWHLLCAVANPRSTAHIRAALATRLWQLPFSQLETILQDEAAWDGLVDQFHAWRAVWQSQGVLPMLHRVLHDQSIPARLLEPDDGDFDGERRLTNLLHLGDLLQMASTSLQGETALIRYLEQHLQHPKGAGDAAQLRLESDANLVQVITVHKSKGLQYPLVFLPFVSHFRAEKEDSGSDDAERLAEDIRLLYVAMTRAEKAMWMGVMELKGDVDETSQQGVSAVARLLQRQSAGDLADKLNAWSACAHIDVLPAPAPHTTPYSPETARKHWKPVLEPQRNLVRHWWTASFSALTRELTPHADGPVALDAQRDVRLDDAQIDSASSGTRAAGSDARNKAGPEGLPDFGVGTLAGEPAETMLPFNSFPAGSRYGTLLHDLLEWQFERGWPIAQALPVQPVAQAQSPEWESLLQRKAVRLNLDTGQCDLLSNWLRQVVSAQLHLPDGWGSARPLVLGDLNRSNAWAEMSFALPVHSLNASRIERLMEQHVLPGHARKTLQPLQLEGMLIGFMDLVLEHEGQYFVLDYKSNRLDDYGPDALRGAILEHRYDVQYTLYTLALHRLLKSRLADYDYDQHVGGAIYLFVRGIDQPGAGLFGDRPPKALIEALDAAFSRNQSSSGVSA